MADLLTGIRRDIDRRLEELRPVLEEFRRLEQAWDALATSGGPQRRRRIGGANAAPRRSSRSRRSRTRMTKAQSQEIDRRVLALLSADAAQKPGTLAMLTETSVGSMNSRLSRLIEQGVLKRRKRGNTIRYEVQQPPVRKAA